MDCRAALAMTEMRRRATTAFEIAPTLGVRSSLIGRSQQPVDCSSKSREVLLDDAPDELMIKDCIAMN